MPVVNPYLIMVTAVGETIPSWCDTEAVTFILGASAHLRTAGFNYKGVPGI